MNAAIACGIQDRFRSLYIGLIQLLGIADAQAIVGGGGPGDEIAENLTKWLDRLVSALPGIVRELAGATAFSISVGANVAVTVEFSSSAGSSARDRLRAPAAVWACAPGALAAQPFPLRLVYGSG